MKITRMTIRTWLPVVLSLTLLSGCVGMRVTDEEITAAQATVDFGDYQSVTLMTKAWQAYEDRDYPATLVLTQKCVELYGEQGKQMNAQLDNFAPVERVNNYWALNDAGTCQYIMATVYEERRMFAEAGEAYRKLADDFTWTQCWDPQGWYWQPAMGAADKADKYAGR